MKATRSKFGKRIIALLLTVIMTVCLIPAMVYGDPDAPITADDFEVLGAGEFTYESGVEHSISINITNTELQGATVSYSYGEETQTAPFGFDEPGSYTVGFTISKTGFQNYTGNASLEIITADRKGFYFENTGKVITYVAGSTTYEQAVKFNEDEEPENITYSITSGPASVSNAGVVTFTAAGTVAVKAVMAESDHYNVSTAEYTVTAKEKGSYSFDNPRPDAIEYGSDFTNAVTIFEGDTIEYSSSDQSVATVDANGKITTVKPGDVTITAAITSANYLVDNDEYGEISYDLHIDKGTQEFKFNPPGPFTLAYNSTLDNKASGTGSGTISYSIDKVTNITSEGEQVVPQSQFGEYVTLTGSVVKVKKAHAKIVIKAEITADTYYKAASATYTINTIRAEQTGFDFNNSVKHQIQIGNGKYLVKYGKKSINIGVVGNLTNPVTYASSNPDIAKVTDDGKVEFEDKATGEVTITATAPEDPDKYFEKPISFVIKIEEENFSNKYTIDPDSPSATGWYTTDVKIIPDEGYLIGLDNSRDADFVEYLEYSDGKYEGTKKVEFYIKEDTLEGAISAKITKEFKIDTHVPTIAIDCETGFWKQLIGTITFGFFNETIEINLSASDEADGVPASDISGIASLKYAVKSLGENDYTDKGNVPENGKISFSPDFDGAIRVIATDNAGNSTTRYVFLKDGEANTATIDLSEIDLDHLIILDDKAPEIEIVPPTLPGDTPQTHYYNANKNEIKITVTDNYYINPGADGTGLTYECNGEDVPLIPISSFSELSTLPNDKKSGLTYTITMNDGDVITDIKVTAEDYATKKGEGENKDTHIYDITPPDITITAPSTAEDAYQNKVEKKDEESATYYYNSKNGTQQLVVEVVDRNLDEANSKITYNLNGNAVIIEFDNITKTAEDSGKVNTNYTYTYTLPLADGDKLDTIKVNAVDLATNTREKEDKNAYVYDVTPPDITIKAPSKTKYANKVGTSYYYTSKQTLEIVVVDRYLNASESYIKYVENYVTKTVKLSELGAPSAEEGVGNPNYTYTFTYEIAEGTEGTMINNVVVYAIDYSNNDSNDSDNNTYIVDDTAPVVSIKADGNISRWYARGSDLYVVFKETATGDSGQGSTNTASETLTITATVTDKNIDIATTKTAGGVMSFYVADVTEEKYAIESDITQNFDSSIVMTKSLTVTPDESGIMSFSIDVVDLAGNRPEFFDTDEILENVKKNITTSDEGGKFSATFISDRNRPSSTEDDINPVIILTPNGDDRGEIVNTKGYKERLYAGSMSYAVTVYDPVYNKKYSGLQAVSWKIDSATKKITTNTTDEQPTNIGAQSQNFTIQVYAPAEIEDNDIVLTVTALDNADNETTYVQYLAIDNWAPRVTVTCDNNDAQNGKYFKADRTITVEIEDINFSMDRTSFTTQVATGWSTYGNRHTATFVYAADGDYSIAGATRDLANNGGDIDFAPVTAYADFTIDKTAPVISITNVNAGEYYNADRTANITITEHNFNAAEVKTDVTASLNGDGIAAPGVSDFASAGDTRSASIDFNVEGDFTITSNYTDLAGNAAETQSVGKFTVDKTKPVINISGVKDATAYTGSVEPVIEISDINFSQDQKDYTVSYSVYRIDKKGSQTLTVPAGTPVSIDGKDAVRISIADLPDTPENDGIYTIVANANDRANNKADEKKITFSVNRFGSVYEIISQKPDNTVDGFVNVRPEIVIRETNPDPVISHSISISINGRTIELTEGKDYTVKELTGGSWNQYEYTIKPDAFTEQGGYVITINSEDKAGNKNSNRTNVEQNSVDIEFTFDEEAPNGYITVDGLGVGKTLVNATSTYATVYWEDNIGTARVEVTVYLDGEVFRTYTVEGEELANLNGNSYLLPEELPEQGGKVYRIEATVTDPAGNEQTFNSGAFKVSTNFFVRFVDNTPLFIGALVALAAVIGLVIFLIARKKKKGAA